MSALTQEQVDKKMQECYAIEDNGQAMDCLAQLIKEAEGVPDVCGPRFMLFTDEGCEVCEAEVKFQKAKIASGVIREVSLNTQEGAKIAEAAGVEYTPALVLMDCHNQVIDFPQQDEEGA